MMKTNELQGAALDWAVAKCEGRREPELLNNFATAWFTWGNVHYSTEWAHGGPIIEREGISVVSDTSGVFEGFVWFATIDDILVDPDEAVGMRGPTPLIAAMRCYVGSQLGNEVEIPVELMEVQA
jgi:hypothetical protein